ncbi:bacteriophage abortive infection AbiH family protein [Nodularia spumigena CS-584]|nr:bacteriophage abortive infection AbiH family protein [Nodularia spumigena CS-584]PZR09993.1 MAG: hypothetical protein DI539_21500 [Flavobacterium psychrophilum]
MGQQLYIIGNGFDIFHGVRSRYSDFEQYVRSTNRNLYDALQEYFIQDELWSDFEATLAEIDTEKIVEDAAKFLADYGAEDWSDSGQYDYQYELQRAINIVTVDLRNAFLDWVLQLEIPNEVKIALPKDCKYFVFNYTRTLQQNYQIPNDNILYIHNEAIDADSSIILGHSRELTSEESFSYLDGKEDLEGNDVRVMEGNLILDDYFKTTYKDTGSIIEHYQDYFHKLHDINEIIILGHSLSDVDIVYFERIVDSVDSQSIWKVSYFEEKDKPINILKTLGIPEGNIFAIKIDEL